MIGNSDSSAIPDDDVYPLYTTSPHQTPNLPRLLSSLLYRQHISTFSETDPDLLKPMSRTRPHPRSYNEFPNRGSSPVYKYKSLSVLDKAWRGVSASLHSYTLVATKATAGLHLLGAQESTEILNAVERHLVSTYPFILSDRGAVAIMDGGDEGRVQARARGKKYGLKDGEHEVWRDDKDAISAFVFRIWVEKRARDCASAGGVHEFGSHQGRRGTPSEQREESDGRRGTLEQTFALAPTCP
ncbi:hypothetical protein V8B97DRAFT_1919216 [Scleroderma yunnanense]